MDTPSSQSRPSDQETSIRECLGKLSLRGTLIYDSKGQTIHRFQIKDLDLIAKSYSLETTSQKIAALLGYSRAKRAYRAALKLATVGVTTPKPYFLRHDGNPWPNKAILVTAFCPHANLLELLQSDQTLHPSTPGKILSLLHCFSRARMSHGDFHARNILVDQEGSPHLIDLDGARHHCLTAMTNRFVKKDRDRMLRSIRPLSDHYVTFCNILGASGTDLPSPPLRSTP